jgi:PAT family beta-lactamase induction signal transducer AmpG
MAVSGGLAITLAYYFGWPFVNVLLGLLYVPMVLLSWKAPEPEERQETPRTLRDAVWHPFLGFLSRHRALEILAFVLLYKLSDQLTQALTRPFLLDMGYDARHRGIALSTVGTVATIVGTVIGSWVTTLVGLGSSLWIFGLLQIVSNLGYFFVASLASPSLPVMYGATGFELLTSGLGTGAYFVLLLRMTQKRFSATQYALFSSLFALPRLLAGPISGFTVDAVGWKAFFLSTLLMGIPGLVMLARFVPPGVREPQFEIEAVESRRPLSRGELLARGVAGGALAGLLALASMALLRALKTMRETPAAGFDLSGALSELLHPVGVTDWVELSGALAFTVIGGLFTAAVFAARHGAGSGLVATEPAEEPTR